MKASDLIAFEESIAAEFNAGEIPYPVHLESGNEEALIDVFREVRPNDWVMGTWRLHLKALLKGVPADELRAAIHRGESMALCFPEYRIFSSAIVGGTAPIALGAAMSIKRRGGSEHAWLFVGDMTAETGIVHEVTKYAANHDLPLTTVIEDNAISVCTSTHEVWGEKKEPHVVRYAYKSKWPHAGAGQRVQF